MRRIPTKPNYSFIVPFHMRTFLAEQMLKFAVALLCCTLVDGMVTKQVINQVTWNPGAVLSDDAWINGTALDPSSVTRSLVMPNEVPLVGLASRMDGIRLSMRLSAMYTWTFIVLSAVALVLWWRMRPKLAEWVIPATYDASRRRFLVVWGLAIAADTLQSQHQVSLMSGYYLTWEQMWTLLQEGMATLFASTLIVGVLCDIFGRKRASAGVLVLRLISSAATSDFRRHHKRDPHAYVTPVASAASQCLSRYKQQGRHRAHRTSQKLAQSETVVHSGAAASVNRGMTRKRRMDVWTRPVSQ